MQTVKINKDLWTIKNYDSDKFRNGDSLQEIRTEEKWKQAGKHKLPAFFNVNGQKFYNWYAINDDRNIATEGFHIPTLKEFIRLSMFAKDNGNNLKGIEQGADNGAGDDKLGYNAILNGYIMYNGCYFCNGYSAYYWIKRAKDYAEDYSYAMNLQKYNGDIIIDEVDKNYGLSIRLVKD